MGIVAFCPAGHRVKVKDHLGGKKGVCPTCGATFRIPRTDEQDRRSVEVAPAEFPVGRLVSTDPTLAAGLPRALRLLPSSPASEPVEGWVSVGPESTPTPPSDGGAPGRRPLHPTIAARPEAAWCHAVPGGSASEPLPAHAMQAWLESGGVRADELVWRSDWPEWIPIGDVFPEYLPRPAGRGPV